MKSARALALLAFVIFVVLFVARASLSPAKPDSAESQAGSYTITIKDFDFAPRNLILPVGAKVTWINKDEEPHKVAEVKSVFASHPLDTDGSFTYTFKSAGNYEYFCTVHPRMTGHIIVGGK